VAAVFVSGVAFAFDTDGHMGVEGAAEVVFWPEMPRNNTYADFGAFIGAGEADRTIEEPDETIEEQDRTTEESDRITEEPDVTTEEPDGTIEEPDVTIEGPEPDMTIEEPNVTTEETAGADGGAGEVAAETAATDYVSSSDEGS
jgi:hypothetical protein